MVRWTRKQLAIIVVLFFVAYLTNPSENSFWIFIRQKAASENLAEKGSSGKFAHPLKTLDTSLKGLLGLRQVPSRSRVLGIDLLVLTIVFYGSEPAFIGLFGIWFPLPKIISFIRNLRYHIFNLRAAVIHRLQAVNLLNNPYELLVTIMTLIYLCWNISPAFMRKHFVLSWYNIRQRRPWCIILAHFSYNSVFQLFRTLNSLYILIPLLFPLTGVFHFYFLCLFGILTSSLFSLASHYKSAQFYSSYSPNGIVYTLFTAGCLLFPQKLRLGILGIPVSPFEGLLFQILLDYLEGYFMGIQTDYAAKLGAALGGWLCTEVVL
eukprot:jgi/Galph1/1021/GphlegSOOS_G5908.1